MEILKRLRLMANLKQKDLAKYLNISSQAYGYYENGKRKPDIKTLKNIADFYQISLDKLINNDVIDEKATKMNSLFNALTENEKDNVISYTLGIIENNHKK